MSDSLTKRRTDFIIYYTGCLFAVGVVGGAAVGVVGGAAIYFPKGLYNSPSGARFIGGLQAVRMNAPRLAGRFAVWGGLYSTLQCALAYARDKEDSWNSILAGAATSGLVSMRQGFGPMAWAAIRTGTLFAFLNRNRFESAQLQMQPVMSEEAPQMKDKAAAPSWGTWGTYSHVFGPKIDPRSLHSPMPPNFDFK